MHQKNWKEKIEAFKKIESFKHTPKSRGIKLEHTPENQTNGSKHIQNSHHHYFYIRIAYQISLK